MARRRQSMTEVTEEIETAGAECHHRRIGRFGYLLCDPRLLLMPTLSAELVTAAMAAREEHHFNHDWPRGLA